MVRWAQSARRRRVEGAHSVRPNVAQPKSHAADMTMKRQRISELYESKEKNASGMVSMTKLSKLLILIEKLTRRTSEATATTKRSDISTLVKRLKKSADRLEKINREGKHAQGADT